jgi:hypothetical protein
MAKAKIRLTLSTQLYACELGLWEDLEELFESKNPFNFFLNATKFIGGPFINFMRPCMKKKVIKKMKHYCSMNFFIII